MQILFKDLFFTVDKNGLDYLEELRYRHPNRSVILRFERNTTFILHGLRLGGFRPQYIDVAHSAILSSPYDTLRPDYNFNILVAPESHSIFKPLNAFF
jgi:hypothetical protein